MSSSPEMIRKKVKVSDSIGDISTLTILPPSPKYLMILGHGAGANMEHHFMQGLAEVLAEYGIGTIRYNFPYMEKKIKRPDPPAIAHKAILQIIRHATNEYPGLVKILGGKSFGGRMASQLIAKDSLPEIQALIFYGFPLHSPAKPGTDRAVHLFEINIPMLFLQGDRDTLARLELLQPLLEKLPTAELHIFEGADHSFKFLKKSGIDETKALDLLASETSRFLNDHNI